MQEKNPRRSNRDRTDATRADLIEAARRLFTDKGYAATGTPELVEAAGVTRGALYHHFADKRALFEAVVEAEAAAVATEIEQAAPTSLAPLDALIEGSRAYLEAMRGPGRTRLLLLDGPAVLGRPEMDTIDARHGNRTLREGLAAAMRAGAIRRLPLDALTVLLGSMLDRAALSIEAGGKAEDQFAVVSAAFRGLGK
jgi:AcrR family transcriptional regulator